MNGSKRDTWPTTIMNKINVTARNAFKKAVKKKNTDKILVR